MSIAVMAWVWRYGPKDATERLVLLAIADHADDDGIAFPSMVGLADKSCLSERGARGVVRRLEAAGWINTKVGGGRGGKSVYHILMQQNPAPQAEKKKPGTKNRESGSPFTRRNPERDDTKPGSLLPPNHQVTITTKKEDPPPPKGGEDCVAILCAVLRPETAEAFIAHRKAKRAKLTAHAAHLIVRKLTAAPDPDAVVERSIMNGWTGVFPESQPATVTPFPSREEARREKRHDDLQRIIAAAARGTT